MDNEFYILQNGQRLGPYTFSELKDKPLEPADIVLLPSQTQGTPAYNMPEFDAYFKSEGIYYPTEKNTSGYWLRLPAFIIDYFIIVLGIVVIATVLFPQYMEQFQQIYTPKTLTYQGYADNVVKHEKEILIMHLVLFIIMVLYNALAEAGRLQASIGKYILGLAVVDDLGYSLTFGQAVKRNLGKAVYDITSIVMGAFSFLFYLRIIWGKRHQAIHDQFANCYIVKKNA